MQSALCSVSCLSYLVYVIYWVLCAMKCAVFRLQCVLCGVHYALGDVCYELCRVPYAVCIVQDAVRRVQFVVQRSVCSLQCALASVQCVPSLCSVAVLPPPPRRVKGRGGGLLGSGWCMCCVVPLPCHLCTVDLMKQKLGCGETVAQTANAQHAHRPMTVSERTSI